VTRQDYVERIVRFGYTETEARFLYLVATHSGYFTQAHFLRFAEVEKGGLSSRLVAKAAKFGHIRTLRFGLHRLVHNLYRRRFYELLGKDNLRNRRHLSPLLIRTRLLILDFVVAHPELRYLETEHDKVEHFQFVLGIPKALLPCRIYKGAKNETETSRYFIDRSPIFLDGEASRRVPVFVYCDHGERSLLGFVSFLDNYRPVLKNLPAFRLIYSSPNAKKFPRAEGFFGRRLSATSRVDPSDIERYFTVRHLWDSGQTGALTSVDRQLLRRGDKQYRDPFFEEIYRRVTADKVSSGQLNALIQSALRARKRAFDTYLLPESYDILDHVSEPGNRDRSGTIVPNASSTLNSTSSASATDTQVHGNTGTTA
jgi:hypothetical protein